MASSRRASSPTSATSSPSSAPAVTALLRLPLVVVAAAIALVTLISAVAPVLGPLVAAAVTLGAGAFALASAGAERRMLWSSLAIGAAAAALRPFVAFPPLDLRFAALDELRALLAHPLRALVPEPESGILLGIVLGERASIGSELREAFARSGTTHLLAISGFNMTLVAAAVALVLRGRVRPILAAAVTVASLAAYSALVGPSASVLRAALMATVAALGVALGRRAVAANALGAAASAMLIADPAALEDVGFLLSAGATAGLIVWQRPIAEALQPLPGPVREGIGATVAATIPTLPIVAAVFGRISLVSPLANLLAVPLFAPLMLAGIATAAVGALWLDAARPVALASYALALALRRVVETSAALPLAAAEIAAGPLTGIVVAAIAALVIRVVPGMVRRVRALASRIEIGRPSTAPDMSISPRDRRVLLGVAGGAAVIILIAFAVVVFDRPPDLRVRALDVGQGDAFLIESAGRTALVDGGPDARRLIARLDAALPPWRRRLDLVVLTHEHVDHGAGLLAVLERYDVRLLIEPRGMNDVPLVRAWAERAARAGVTRKAVSEGARIRLGEMSFEVLAPNGDPRVDVPSLVIRLERGSFSMLFTGDATDAALADLLLRPEALAARVYVPPHHGASSAYAATLVAAVRPEAAVLSVGAGNRYGHPAPATLAALERILTYRTDLDGTVEIALDGQRLVITPGAPASAASARAPGRRGSVPGSAPSR